MTEQELRDAKVPWPKTRDELMAFMDSLMERPHEYGTCVYAMSMCAVAAYYYVSHVLGATSFQASLADLDILRRTRRMEYFRIVNWEGMLYPQYENEMQKTIAPDIWKWLQSEAKRKLAEKPVAHPAVRAHWQSIVDGIVPFGYNVVEE